MATRHNKVLTHYAWVTHAGAVAIGGSNTSLVRQSNEAAPNNASHCTIVRTIGHLALNAHNSDGWIEVSLSTSEIVLILAAPGGTDTNKSFDIRAKRRYPFDSRVEPAGWFFQTSNAEPKDVNMSYTAQGSNVGSCILVVRTLVGFAA
jgi:hypothetical protein